MLLNSTVDSCLGPCDSFLLLDRYLVGLHIDNASQTAANANSTPEIHCTPFICFIYLEVMREQIASCPNMKYEKIDKKLDLQPALTHSVIITGLLN